MNAPTNLGTLNFIPIFSKGAGGFYQKFDKVYEFFGNTSLIESGEAWFKVLQKDLYGDLSPEQSALYDEVAGLLTTLKDDYELSYEELRVRNYVAFFGLGLMLSNKDGKKNEEVKDQPALFVYPNQTPISAFLNTINGFKDTYGSTAALTKILNTNNTGREGVVQINFKTKDNGQPGYDCSVSFPMNNPMTGTQIVDPAYVIPDETIAKFDNITSIFLGWQYNHEDKVAFNDAVFKELRDNLKLRLKEAQMDSQTSTQETFENKNDLTPKMTADPTAPF
jgi:hypothetical protein